MTEISFYNNSFDTAGTVTDLDQLLSKIRNGEWSEPIAKVRGIKDKALRSRLKRSLPAATISGQFTKRDSGSIQKHSGFICLDVDNISDPASIKEVLCPDPVVFSAFVSCSGNGLAIIMKISQTAAHKDLFQQARSYLLDHYGLVTDSTQDVARLRYISHDPVLYKNTECKTFNGYKRPNFKDHDSTNDLSSLVEAIVSKGADLTNDYSNWIQVGLALVSSGDPLAKDYFHRISSLSSKYDRDKTETKYINLQATSSGKVGIGTLYYLAKSLGGLSLKPSQTDKPKRKQSNNPTEILISDVDTSDRDKIIEKHSRFLIGFDEPIIDSPPLIGIIDGDQVHPIFTLGNISCSKGKAKSRKSFGCTLFLSALFYAQENESDLFQGSIKVNLPPVGKRGALYIDTEQSKPDVQRCMHRIPKLTEYTPDNLYVYQLRKAETIEERLTTCLEAIDIYKDEICFVAIDGIADLGRDINDRAEFLTIILKFMALTEEHNLHIHFVLHENKSGTDARGHAGTELTNKSETVLQFQKHPDLPKYTTIVRGEYTRGMGWDDWSFTINDGLPMIDEYAKTIVSKSKVTHDPSDFEDKKHIAVLKNQCNIVIDKEYTRKDIEDRLGSGWKKEGVKISVRKLATFLNYYLDMEMLVKTGKDRSPKQRYK